MALPPPLPGNAQVGVHLFEWTVGIEDLSPPLAGLTGGYKYFYFVTSKPVVGRLVQIDRASSKPDSRTGFSGVTGQDGLAPAPKDSIWGDRRAFTIPSGDWVVNVITTGVGLQGLVTFTVPAKGNAIVMDVSVFTNDRSAVQNTVDTLNAAAGNPVMGGGGAGGFIGGQP